MMAPRTYVTLPVRDCRIVGGKRDKSGVSGASRCPPCDHIEMTEAKPNSKGMSAGLKRSQWYETVSGSPSVWN